MNDFTKRLRRAQTIVYVAYELTVHKTLDSLKKHGWAPSVRKTRVNSQWQPFVQPVTMKLYTLAENIHEPVGEDFFRSLQGNGIVCCHGSQTDSLTSSPADRYHTLVTFGSDDPFDDKKRVALQKVVKRAFCINSTTQADWITCIPLGLQAKRFCTFDKSKVLKECLATHHHPTKLLYGNFSLWTNRKKRYQCLSALENKDYFTNRVETALPPAHDLTSDEYRSFCMELLDHLFVACPEGNGLDTHRMWETIYLGRIPVVLHNPVTDAFPHLPILRLNSWKDFESNCLDFLQTFPQKDFNTEVLTQAYWKEKITASARDA